MKLSKDPNPTLARRRSAVSLRRARERNGRSLDDLADVLGVSLPQASRLDSGARGFSLKQLELLGRWYGLGERERARLALLVEESRGRRAWWQQVDLPDAYRTLIGLEKGATSIREYCSTVIPGVLQTERYGRAAIAGSIHSVADDLAEQALYVRTRRQRELLAEEPRPLMSFIVDEAVLARTTGGAGVMATQLGHLLDVSADSSVTIQVVGFDVGVHVGSMQAHFIWLEFGDSMPDVVYREGSGEPSDSDDPVLLHEARLHWHLLSSQAMGTRESRLRIERYRRALLDDM